MFVGEIDLVRAYVVITANDSNSLPSTMCVIYDFHGGKIHTYVTHSCVVTHMHHIIQYNFSIMCPSLLWSLDHSYKITPMRGANFHFLHYHITVSSLGN